MPKKSKLTTETLDQIIVKIDTTVKSALIATAIDVAATAAAHAPVDTGFLQQSIHVTSMNFSGYEQSRASSTDNFLAALATGRTPKGRRLGPRSANSYQFFPEATPTNPNEVWVVVGAVHGIENELSPITGKSFLRPALYDNLGNLTGQIRKSLRGLSVKGKRSEYSNLGSKDDNA